MRPVRREQEGSAEHCERDVKSKRRVREVFKECSRDVSWDRICRRAEMSNAVVGYEKLSAVEELLTGLQATHGELGNRNAVSSKTTSGAILKQGRSKGG